MKINLTVVKSCVYLSNKQSSMVTNFEEITEDLTDNELKNLTRVKECLLGYLSYKKENAIIQRELVNHINSTLEYMTGEKRFMTPVRLRKFINHFRSNGIIPIIATSEGCYLAENKEEIQKQIISLEQRSRSIQKAADGLKKFL